MKNNKKHERLGEENYNRFGTLMRIVEYNSNKNIVVVFQDKYETKVLTRYDHFKEGIVKNPYDKEICNIGYLGIGKYKTKDKDGKKTKAYNAWSHMIQRCYDPYIINKHLTYKDCYVCDEWHCFQNFAKWFEENMYDCNGEVLELDKDILNKGNKMYSPKNCCLVPNKINILFTKRQNYRGEYLIGCHYHKSTNKIIAQCSCEKGKTKYLGVFPLDKPFQAFYTYKIFKENYIKQVADEYKNLIPKKIYEAMYKYEIEIND